MKTVPGFTAETTLFRSGSSYATSAPIVAVELRAQVQLSRATGPYGPIGLPGQRCEEACTHICMMGSIFPDRCIAECRSVCLDSSLSILL